MLCLKKRRTYSFTQGACADLPRRSNKDNNRFDESLNMAITTLPRKNRSREERPSRMVLTVTEDTPADMLAGSMELLVQLPRDNNSHTQRVTVQRSTPMMDLLVQIATAHKLAASSYTLQAIGERGLVLPHQPNTPIGALDALQVKLLPKQGTFLPRKTKQANQPFETTFRLQVHLPRNQLYVSRVSPKMNLGEILDEVCREKNLDRNKYELRHPANLEETLDLSLSLQDYHLQEVTLYAKQGRSLGSALSTQDIMALQRQEERRRQQAKQGVFGFIFKKSKESSLSTDSLGGRSVSPARSDETGRSASPLAPPPARPQRKRRPAPKPPVQTPPASTTNNNDNNNADDSNAKDKDKMMVISHSRNSSDSSGYHEASVLSDNPDSAAARLPETLPRRSRIPNGQDTPRKLAQTSQASKSLGNLAVASGSLGHAVSSTSLSSTGLRKKRAAPPPPVARPLSSAISTQALERIVDSEESLTSDMDPSKPPSDIGAPSKASSDIEMPSKANSDLGIGTLTERQSRIDANLRGSSPREPEVQEIARESENSRKAEQRSSQKPDVVPVDDPAKVERSRVPPKRVGEVAPLPAPRRTGPESSLSGRPVVPKRRYPPPSAAPRTSRAASQVSDETASDNRLRDSPPEGQEAQGERVDKTMRLADEMTKEGPAEADVARKDVRERRIESFSEVGAADETSEVQGNSVDESEEFVAFSGGEKRREAKGIGAECSKDLDSESIAGMSSVDDTKEEKCEDSNTKNVAEEMRRTVVEKSEDSTVGNFSEHVTEVKGNAKQISPEDIEREDKDNEVNGALNINDNDISITKSRRIDAEKPKLNVNNRTYSTEFDAESSQQSPAIVHAINNKVVGSSCKTQSLDTEMETEKCENKKKSKEASFRAMRQAKSMNDIRNVDCENQEKTSPKKSRPDDKKSCMIVSTIPKCDHFDIPGHDMRKPENHESLQRACLLKSRTLSMDDLKEKVADAENGKDAGKGSSEVPSPRRTKICRSQSEFRDFEESSLKKQRKHLTSHAQDFAFALNLNLPAKQPKESLMRDADRENSHVTLTGRSEKSENLSETDILLQKVSDTLSSSLPAPSSPVPEVEKPTSRSSEEGRAEILESSLPREPTATKKLANSKDEAQRSTKVCATSNETNANVNSPNATINSQQDTSDYVSAMSDDLSVTDWEYQLPDPPSAFRDTNSPAMDGYDTITLRSVDAFQETQGSDPVEGHAEKDTTDFSSANAPIRSDSFAEKSQREVKTPHLKEESRAVTKDVQRTMKTENRSPVKRSNSEPRPQLKTASNFELKKEVISELENKIETGCLPAGKEPDFRKTVDSAPAIAPVENPLSNFTITTYTRQKSLNIFEEVQEQPNAPVANKLDERVIKTFATLSRSKTLADHPAEKYSVKNNASSNGFEAKKTDTKEQARPELTNKWQAINGEKELHSQQQQRNNPDDVERDIEKNENIKNSRHENVSKSEGIREKKFATVLNAETPRSKEKFALWRDNILNRQEEPTKEKQLQSIQVLKSILPQLKQTQQTEENVSEECNKLQEKKRLEMRSNEHSADPNVVSTEESQAESEQKTSKERIKQYTYAGPPAISLGSWSERPCVNVQIKMDTDYKFGKSNASGTRTLVNLNSRDQTDTANKANEEESSSRVQEAARTSQDVKRAIRSQASTLERKEPDEFTRKLITHTTATGFKKATLNKVSAVESKPKSEEKPVVMGVELKKSFVERQDVTVNSHGNEIDTTPVNFKELTKTFGQEVCFRTKPKRVNQSRLSDCYGTSVKLAEHGNKQNGHVADQANDPMKSSSVENGTDSANHLRTRRYTSVVGINNSLNQSFGQQAANHSARNNVKSTKINQPMPVVKGFNFQTEIRSNARANQNGFNTADSMKKDLQKPSTVPVITGVTLKSASARPKSMPVSVDQRDILLESIRNFGGSKKLKSVAARY